MNRSKYPRRPQLNERLELAITPELKERAYEMAAKKGKPASDYIRDAIERSLQAEMAQA